MSLPLAEPLMTVLRFTLNGQLRPLRVTQFLSGNRMLMLMVMILLRQLTLRVM